MLAVSSGDNHTRVFQQSSTSESDWVAISEVNDRGEMVEAGPDSNQDDPNHAQAAAL